MQLLFSAASARPTGTDSVASRSLIREVGTVLSQPRRVLPREFVPPSPIVHGKQWSVEEEDGALL